MCNSPQRDTSRVDPLVTNPLVTNPLVTILDYGSGNLRSVAKAFERAGARTVVTAEADRAGRGDLLVVPGVGHFGQCAGQFKAAGFGDLVASWTAAGKPVFGICVGMQILYGSSEEDPEAEGLGLLPGAVRRLPAEVTVPHMGWNTVRTVGAAAGEHAVFDGIDGEQFYFANSYYADPADDAHVVAVCEYGPGFPCVVRTGSVIGTQFHPEKSSDVGARLLANLLRTHT